MSVKMRRRHQLVLGPAQLRRRIGKLIRQPIFIFVTLWGHAVILLGTLGFYYFENSVSKHVSLFDSLYWTIATVSLVGDGNMSPVTPGGRIVAMMVMILGSLFLWSYMALFVGWLIAPEIQIVEDEVRDLGNDVAEVEREMKWDQKRFERLLNKLEVLLNEQEDLKSRVI